MKQVLFMVMLAADMLLAGCSQDSENYDMETKRQQTLTKEQIIGVWRNGDYWVSFDGNGREHVEGTPVILSPPGNPYYYSGINRGFLNIDGTGVSVGGKYYIEGNVITVEQGLEKPIEYIVTQIDESSMSFVITGKYNEEPFSETMTFWKSEDTSVD